MNKIPLLDIDGTLLRPSNKTHVAGYAIALRGVFGITIDISAIEMRGYQGMTDSAILVDLSEKNHIPRELAVEKLPKLCEYAAQYFLRHVESPDERLPGAQQLINFFRRQEAPFGILTGNIRKIGDRRLEISLLSGATEGAYGDDSCVRADLVAIAQKRISHQLNRKVSLSELCIIGDTVRDIECARAAGIAVIAVATGGSTMDELEKASPDLLVSDLKKMSEISKFLNS